MRRTWIDFDLATSDLSDNAFRVMVYLLLHANKDGDCWLNLGTIAEQTRRSKRSLDFAISELKLKNLVESHREGNQGKGQTRYRVKLTPSATYCARSGDGQAQKTTDQAQRIALDHDRPSAKNDRPSAKSEATKRKICTDQAQKVKFPPSPPYIGEQGIEQGINKQSRAGDATPQGPDTECLSVSNASLPDPEPKQEIPPDVKRMSSQLQLESWIGELKFQGVSLTDWRVKETLGIIHAQGGKKGSRYAWGVFRKLPEQKPEPAPTANLTQVSPTEPKRIMSKDGKKVLIGGEWLTAATPYENMPAPQIYDELGDIYDSFVFELQDMPIETPVWSEAIRALRKFWDDAKAKKINQTEFSQLGRKLVDALKGGAA